MAGLLLRLTIRHPAQAPKWGLFAYTMYCRMYKRLNATKFNLGSMSHILVIFYMLLEGRRIIAQ